MSPSILIIGFLAFLFPLVLHVFIWRTVHPKSDFILLFIIFFVAPLLPLGIYFFYAQTPVAEMVAILILYEVLSTCYVYVYTAAQPPSPTMAMTVIVDRSMPKGITREKLSKYFDDRNLVLDRFDDLLSMTLILKKDESYSLTLWGRALIFFIDIYQKLLAIPR